MADGILQAIEGKLKIIPGTKAGSSYTYNPTEGIEMTYNPESYDLKKDVQYKESNNPGLESSLMQFKHGTPQNLKFKTTLDTYCSILPTKEDIRTKYIEKLEKLVKVDGDIHAPPPCKIVWGTFIFIGYLTAFSYNITMFTSDGTPVRASVDFSFREYEPIDQQANATAKQSPDKRKLYVVREGECLWHLSERAYADPAKWRIIADANQLDNPKKLTIGRELIIPVLD